MSLDINADKQELRSSNLNIISSSDLTLRSGSGSDEKEVFRALVDPVNKLPRVGINRTGRKVDRIILQTAGSNYTISPDVIIEPPDDTQIGIQATATAVILGGSVVAIAVDNPGFGYTLAPTVTISGGGGSGASANAVLDSVDFELDVNGAIRTSTSIISDTARILNLDIENFVTPDINFRAPDLKLFSNANESLWQPNLFLSENSIVYFGDNLYKALNSGITGNSAPLFKDNQELNGEVLFQHVGYRIDDQSKPFYNETIYPKSVTPSLGDRSTKIATTEYVLNLATNDVGGRVYVSQEIGNDQNNGRSAAAPVRTIKRACQIASESVGVKETIIISGGDYVEDNPISIPPDCSVVGDNLRLVIIRPNNPRKHVFKFADKNYITGIVFRDKIDAEGTPIATWDYAVSFDDKQRLYYDPSVGGDFERNFPIGHQIFGESKFRVTFQNHTGGNNFFVGETVRGVNTGAIGQVISITFDQTTGPQAYISGTFDILLVSGSFSIGETFEYEVGDPAIIYEMVSNDIRSIRAEGEVVSHNKELSQQIPIVRIDGSLQGTFTDGFGPDGDGGGIVFYTNELIGRQNIHDYKEGQEILISGLTGNLSGLNGVQRIYKVIEDADGRARRFVIPKKLPEFIDSNFIPTSPAFVRTYSYYVLVSLLNSPNKFERTSDLGRRWQDATNLIKNNIEFIKDESYLQIIDEFPAIDVPNETKCRRDIGHFVNAIINDLQYDSNFNVIEAAKRYIVGTQIGFVGSEITETIRAFDIARRLAILAMRNWRTGDGTPTDPVYTPLYSSVERYFDNTVIDDLSSPACANVASAIDTLGYLFVTILSNNTADRFLDASYLIARNEEFIASEALGYAQAEYPTLGLSTDDENKCKRDILFILEGLRRDLSLGGNAGIVEAAEAYFTGVDLTGIPESELSPTRYAFEKVRDLAILAMRNWKTGVDGTGPVYTPLYETTIPLFIDSTITVDPSTPICADVASAITTSFALLDDILSGEILPGATTKTFGTLYNTDSVLNIPDNTVYDANNQRLNVMTVYDDLPIIEASPYIQNASVISFLGGGGAEIDGKKVKQPNCPFPGLEADGRASFPNQGKSMVAAQFTIITFNGNGYLIKNDGYTQLVSVFVLFARDGVLAESGGYASITNSATNFGIYALRAIGFREEPYIFDIGTIESTNITANGSTILRVGGLGREPLEHYIVKFEDYENQDPDIEYFVDGVSQVSVGPPFTASLTLNAPILIKRKSDGSIVPVVDDAEMVGKVVKLHRPSIVNSSSHTWEYAGSGTDYNALPENGGTKIDAFEQVSENYGRVYVSGTDELGDFKVGTFAKIENRTGAITFTGTVSISEVEFLKLKGGEVVVTGFSASNTLGGAFSSNSIIPTQKAVRDYIGNNLGPYLNKPYSTNAVPRALVELTDSGKISIDQIPALRPFNVFTVANESERLALEGPLAGDIAIQSDTSTSFILQDDLTSLYLGIPVDGSYVFTNGLLVTGNLTTGRILVTEYRQGVVYEIQIVDGGSGYTSVPTVTISSPGGSGIAAAAVATIANGEVVTVKLLFNNGFIGGKGYTSAPTVTFSAPGAGGTTASANALLESRVYGNIVNNIKISDTDSIQDHAGTPNTINVTRVVNTSASGANNWVSLSASSVSASDITSGVISTSRLAENSNEANSFTFLAGDQTYKPTVQTVKAQEPRYFLKTVSSVSSNSPILQFAFDSRLVVGHQVFGSGINENTTISNITQSEGILTVSLSSPTIQPINSNSVITFVRSPSALLFESSLTQSNYVDSIVIANGGTGFTNGEYFGLSLEGGTGTGLTANIIVSAGEVVNVVVTSGGVNYTDDFVISSPPPSLGSGVGLVLQAKIASSVKNTGVIGMDIRRVDDKTLSADPYGNIGVARFLKSDTALGRIGQFRFAPDGGVFIDQGPESGFDADKLDGQQGLFYLDGSNFLDASITPGKLASGTYNIAISGQSGNTLRLTTSTSNPSSSPAPNVFSVGIISDWRNNTADGLSDGGTAHGVITFRQFGSANDSTGGGVRQLAFTDNDNLWIRGSGSGVSAFGSWAKVWTSLNDGVGSELDSDRLDGRQGTFYQNAQNINSGKLGAFHLPDLFTETNIFNTITVNNYPGLPYYDIYISGKILNTFPFLPGQVVNLYDSNSQGVGTISITNVVNSDSLDNSEDFTVITGRLENGGFNTAVRIGTASINEIFHDYTLSTVTSYPLASLSGTGGTARLQLGRRDGTSSSPIIDFNTGNSSATFNVRLEASGGNQNNGSGALDIKVLNTNSLTVNNNIVWNAGNISFNTGISGSAYTTAANGTAVLRDSSGNFAANNIIASLTGAASLNVLKSGDTMSGDLTVGSVTRASTSFVRVLSNDANNAGFEAYGNSQGTGYLYVGQSSIYGGGLVYNGDGTPAFATGEVADRISFFRKDNGTNTIVFDYAYNSDTVNFRGQINSPEGVFNGTTRNNGNDATVFITATNNNDWGLIVDKFNGSATNFGVRIDTGNNAATLALQIRGNDVEVFKVAGSGAITGTSLTVGTGAITSGAITTSGTISLTTNSTRIQQTSTSTWSGDAGTGFGKLEYHSNRWYINAGSNSTEVARFRRGATDVLVVDNSGNTSFGNTGTATITSGLLRVASGTAGDGIQITGTNPTITFRDTDHRTGYIHVNSNLMYFLCGANNAAPGAWRTVANGRWPLYLNLTNNQAVFGGDIDANTGNIFARSFRTPAASFGSTVIGNAANNNNYVLYANGDRQWLDSFGVIKANRTSIGENITIPTTTNAASIGPITINNGFTVFVTNGAVWTVT